MFHAAKATGRNPFVTCVGREDEPVRMRSVSFAYDGSYPGEPLPIITLEFRPVSGLPGVTLDRVIANTGADAGGCLGGWGGPASAPRAGQAGWGASRAVRHQRFTFVSGSTWTDRNIQGIPVSGNSGVEREFRCQRRNSGVREEESGPG